jgi:hypothetical protein
VDEPERTELWRRVTDDYDGYESTRGARVVAASRS